MKWGMDNTVREAQAEAHRAHIENWHWYFAWHPVRLLDGTWVWLEYVHRRLYWQAGWGVECDGAGWVPEYKQ